MVWAWTRPVSRVRGSRARGSGERGWAGDLSFQSTPPLVTRRRLLDTAASMFKRGKRGGGRALIGLGLIFVLGLSSAGHAVEPSARHITQYSRQAWLNKDGLPQNTVSAIQQTREGYLWLATWEGLARFDGADFKVFNRHNTPELVDHGIRALVEDGAGGLWLGSKGVLRYENGKFQRLPDEGDLRQVIVPALALRGSTLWVASALGLEEVPLVPGGTRRRYTSKDGLPSTLVDAVTVDEVRIYTGDGSDRAAFKAHARMRKLTLTSVDAARSVTVEDKRGLQAVRLSQPLPGARFILEVVARFPGASDEAPVCITDLVFYSGGKALNGTWLASRLKYNARLAPLLGTWFGGLEGAPEGFLSFYLDGTYRYTREPLEGGGPTSVTGTYTLSGTRLSLEVPKRGRVTLRLQKGGDEGARLPEASLTVEGPLAEEWGHEFRGKP